MPFRNAQEDKGGRMTEKIIFKITFIMALINAVTQFINPNNITASLGWIGMAFLIAVQEHFFKSWEKGVGR